jgi:putative sporulation protein YtaF
MLLHTFSLVLLAFALSLDGFGVGVTYGLRKIRIPLLSIFIISACSGIIIYLSMQIGVWIAQYVSPDYSKWIGAIILIGIGSWALIQLFMSKSSREDNDHSRTDHIPAATIEADAQAGVKKTVFLFEIKVFGLVIQILKTPSVADVDRSGSISASEAALLGVALSLDAFGAGLGAALLGFSPLWTCISIAIASGTFLYLGPRVGFMFAGMRWIRKLSIIPGIMLIIMGILRFF